MSYLGIDPLPWYRDARCAEEDVSKTWFHSGDLREVNHAKRVCQGCPVRQECLEYALTTPDQWGVWGGLSERERRVILRRRPVQVA